ncbi:unnamed protein product [Cylindrotheca closterium]|uniref:Uncharacterized protein n=1 Tax=Cylindrotheca closterium TaxID=2856 RepID=A0AAD2JNM0_9STRA|nr:unnamed protein product [Cylindrotheca closterium]
MAEIETVLVRDFPSLETPRNNRKPGAKSLNMSSSASTFVETPMANDDSPDTLHIRAISTEGKRTTDILKDLDTPPRSNHRKLFLSKMMEEFPSPAIPNGILSPSMSEVTAPSAFKERNHSFASSSPSVSDIDFSISQTSMKPSLLFREKETKRAMDFSTVFKSRSAPVRNHPAAVLPVTPEAESEKKPMARESWQLHNTPESQPGRIVINSLIRDDVSWCASSACPFDCVEDYDHTSVPPALEEANSTANKESGLSGLFKKSSISRHRSIPESRAENHQTGARDNEGEVETQDNSSTMVGMVMRVERMSKLFGFFSKISASSEQRVEGSMPDDEAMDTEKEVVDIEGGEPVDSEFAESLGKNISNEHPIDESPGQNLSSSGSDTQKTKESPGNPENMISGNKKDVPELDDTVAPSRSYDDDAEHSSQQTAEQSKRYAKRFIFYIFVPALVLSIIILASILVKRMTDRETSYSVTSQTLPPTDIFDFRSEQTRRPIDVPPFFDNTHKLCNEAQKLTPSSKTYDSMSRTAWDNTINTCGDSLEFGFAAWYSVTVDESRFMEASTCNDADFDTQITIMSGVCEELSCVTFSDNECGAQSRATWYAEKGKSYVVVVGGYREEWGEYTLSLNPTTINDKCQDSVSSVAIDSTVFGTTSGATIEDLPSCGGVDTTKPGVWYEVSNVDGPVNADVIGRGFNFAGQVSVYDGSCDALSCAAGSKSGSVTWDALPGSTYHVYVNGEAVDGDFGLFLGRENKESCNEASPLQPSNFAYISSTRDARQQEVESCGFDGRQHSAPGKWFSLIGTGNEFKVSTCSADVDLDTEVSLFQGSCGALQCVAGTGRALPCAEGGVISWKTVPDSMYYIYVSGRGSRVGDFWLTIEETEVVGSICTEHLALGAFSTKSIKGFIEVGSTEPVQIEGLVGTARGVWYELIGTGNLVELSVCGMDSSFDGRVSVSTGDCSDRIVLGQTSKCGEDGDNVKFVTTVGHKYQVFVHGDDDEATGEYTLSMKDYDELNDRCALALPLETVSGVYFGSTTNAIISDAIDVIDAKNTVASAPSVTSTPTRRPTIVPTSAPSALPTETSNEDEKADNKGGKDKKDKENKNKDGRKIQEIIGSCDFIPPTFGLWYKIDGSGGDIIVSTCSEDTNFDTAIDIFIGGCGDLQCITSNDDSCGSQSLLATSL